MASIYEQAQKFRADLIKRDTAAVEFLTNQYKEVYGRILRALASLNNQIDEARRGGQVVSKAWLNQQWRYQSFLRQLDQEFRQYSGVVNQTVSARQAFEFLQGRRDASAMIGGQFNQLPVRALQNIVGNLRDTSPLGKLLNSFGADAGAHVATVLRDAIALGHNPRKIAGQVRDALGVPLHRALMITRTESNRAYRQATNDTYQASDEVTGFIWVSSKSKRTCLACLALDGVFFPKDKPQPSHVNCIPAGAIIHTPRVDSTSSRFYQGEVVELTTASGQQLTVTPNHPILTSRGWVAAGFLNESDNVVSTRFPERILSAVNPDEQNPPARIEQIVGAFSERRGMLSVSVPTAPEDFHGDGKGSQVQVVTINGLLGNGFDAAGFEPFIQDEFIGRSMGLMSLPGLRASNFLFDVMLSPDDGLMCRGCVGSIFFGSAVSHHQAISRGRISDFDARGKQARANGSSRYAESLSDLLFGDARPIEGNNFLNGQFMSSMIFQRLTVADQQAVNNPLGDTKTAAESVSSLTGLVEFDKIRELRKFAFSGHVYNLQTATGWYIANRIITHNCRCTSIPFLEGQKPLRRETAGQWFEKQPDSVKREQMGDSAFEAYKAGKVTLQGFVGRADSRKWGTAYYELSLKRALAGEAQFPG